MEVACHLTFTYASLLLICLSIRAEAINVELDFLSWTDPKDTNLSFLRENMVMTLKCNVKVNGKDPEDKNAFNSATDSLVVTRQSGESAPTVLASHKGLNHDAPVNIQYLNCSNLASDDPCLILIISNTTRSDSGNYHCEAKVYERNKSEYTEVIKTKTVDILFPPSGDVTCHPSYRVPFYWEDGSSIRLTCSSDSGNPAVTLQLDITDKSNRTLYQVSTQDIETPDREQVGAKDTSTPLVKKQDKKVKKLPREGAVNASKDQEAVLVQSTEVIQTGYLRSLVINLKLNTSFNGSVITCTGQSDESSMNRDTCSFGPFILAPAAAKPSFWIRLHVLGHFALGTCVVAVLLFITYWFCIYGERCKSVCLRRKRHIAMSDDDEEFKVAMNSVNSKKQESLDPVENTEESKKYEHLMDQDGDDRKS
ncbi:uncharacterized protein [Amphiura filiformis]|uniref:uncharacterized protein n=1 Tax=Amphiura filiformis TaxID=82378 RepID=UPI003B2131B6